MINYNQYMTETRRLGILELLVAAPAYTMHEHALRAQLREIGHACSIQELRADLQNLADQSLINLKNPEDCYVATLTAEGNDVRQGYTSAEGVARPEPK